MPSSGDVESHLRRLLHGRLTHSGLAQIHARAVSHGLHQSNLLATQLVLAAGALRSVTYAVLIFLQVRNPKLLLYNALFKAYSLAGARAEPLRFFSDMKRRGIHPDRFTYATVLKSCANLRHLRYGAALHSDVLTLGLHSLSSIRIAVVELYVTCGSMSDAVKAAELHALLSPDAVVYNLLIRGYCKDGDLDAGLAVFRRMEPSRTVVTWNTMLTGLANAERDGEVLKLFADMWESGDVTPDEVTLVIILPAVARVGAIDLGQRIHNYAGESGFLVKSVAVGNALIDMYCKCGDLDAARSVFDGMPQRSVVTWNSMISGMALHGHGEAGMELFEQMRVRSKQGPNEVTFIAALSCCSHAGMVAKGRELFRLMSEEMKFKPNAQHYGCMVDLLGRSGHLREAYELVCSMPEMGTSAPAIWGALLSACRNHGELEIAECAAKELIRLEPSNSGNYVLLCNIYADAGRWDEVERLRVLMKGTNVLKNVGHSSVQSNQ